MLFLSTINAGFIPTYNNIAVLLLFLPTIYLKLFYFIYLFKTYFNVIPTYINTNAIPTYTNAEVIPTYHQC